MIFLSWKRKKTVSHVINEIPEASFKCTKDDNITLPAAPLLTISPPVFSNQSFFWENRHYFIVCWYSSDQRMGIWFKKWRFMATFQASWASQNNRGGKAGWSRRNTNLFYQKQCGLWRYLTIWTIWFLMALMGSRILATSFVCFQPCSAAICLRLSPSCVSSCGHAAI